MEPNYSDLAAELAAKGIRPSPQRIRIMDYLVHNPCHPTVDRIYHDLHQEMPTLSKTTIYSSLEILKKANLVRELSIENHETRYDILVGNHGHFQCETCGRIFDFPIDIDRFAAEELQNCEIHQKNVYFQGICPQCLKNRTNSNTSTHG